MDSSQRSIARALLLDTRYLVAYEIISMLDASTRIDVLNLLGDLKERGLGILFITHDLSLGNYISDRTVILRRGRIVEMGATRKVFGNPLYPYTRMLLESVLQLHAKWGVVRAGDGDGGDLAERCVYHEVYPPAAGGEGVGDGPQTLAAIEADHAVACARLDEGGCR